MIKLIKYGTTNTYLIKGTKGSILFDTGWAGTLRDFCRAMGEAGEKVQDITYLLISHYHPDHMGIAQEIADMGATILAVDIQTDYLHSSDQILQKDKRAEFKPIRDENVRVIRLEESRQVLKELGIDGCIYSTPGHSDDSISLLLDTGELFVGDLNPLYELELHKGSQIEKTWSFLLDKHPKKVYYGHAPAVDLRTPPLSGLLNRRTSLDIHALVQKVIKLADKRLSIDAIAQITGSDRVFVEDVIRMYVTHPGVSIQGILDRIEIKGR